MKILVKILLIILGCLILFFVSGLFMRTDYAIEKEVMINKPNDSVFNYLKYQKNQQNFAMWFLIDPTIKKHFPIVDGTVGSVMSWKSTDMKVGVGSQEIVNIIQNKRIDFILTFKEPFEAKDDAYFVVEPVSDSITKVKWGFKGHMKYPLNMALTLLQVDEKLAEDLQKGLNNLKLVLEKK